MPRGARCQDQRLESFHIDLAEWSFDYSFHLNPLAKHEDLIGRCWEVHAVEIRGPLRSKTRRRVERVTLRIHPRAATSDTWPETAKGIGTVTRLRRGVMEVWADLPAAGFHSVLIALVSGKIASVSLGIDFTERSGFLRDLHVSSGTHRLEEDE